MQECNNCFGTGLVNQDKFVCKECGGIGKIPQEINVVVDYVESEPEEVIVNIENSITEEDDAVVVDAEPSFLSRMFK